MPPSTVQFWDERYEGELVNGPRNTRMRAQDFWYFLTHEDMGVDDFVQVNVTPIGYTQSTGAMWDQSMDLAYLFPPELELSESMEGVWDTERSWAETQAAMQRVGFVPLPQRYLDRWGIGYERLQPPEPRDQTSIEATPGRMVIAQFQRDLIEREDQLAQDALRRAKAVPEPPVERKSAWERLLNDDED